MFVDNLICGLT